MMKCYHHLFYFNYKIAVFLGNEGFFPEALAYFITAMLPWLNFLTVINVIELNTNKSITNPALIMGAYISFLIINYLYFFASERYKLILEESKKVSNLKLKTLIVLFYVIVSLVLHFYFSDLRRSLNIL